MIYFLMKKPKACFDDADMGKKGVASSSYLSVLWDTDGFDILCLQVVDKTPWGASSNLSLAR